MFLMRIWAAHCSVSAFTSTVEGRFEFLASRRYRILFGPAWLSMLRTLASFRRWGGFFLCPSFQCHTLYYKIVMLTHHTGGGGLNNSGAQ